MTWEGLTPPYGTICADPPWSYDNDGTATKVNANRHYSTMCLSDILAMPVADLAASSAHLWLWVTNAFMEEGYAVVRAWGFKPLTLVTWCKPGPGVGHYLRNNTEHIILASRGAPQTPDTKPLSTWFQWGRTPHSVKPPASYDLIEQVSPGPYVELFSRTPRFSWDCWGRGFESELSA